MFMTHKLGNSAGNLCLHTDLHLSPRILHMCFLGIFSLLLIWILLLSEFDLEFPSFLAPWEKKITLKIMLLQIAPLCLYRCSGECALFFTWELCSVGVPWSGKTSDRFFKNQLASAINHRDAFSFRGLKPSGIYSG